MFLIQKFQQFGVNLGIAPSHSVKLPELLSKEMARKDSPTPGLIEVRCTYLSGSLPNAKDWEKALATGDGSTILNLFQRDQFPQI